MSEKEFELDEGALELFRQLEGLDHSDRTLAAADLAPQAKETITDLLLNLDECRIQLIEFAELISAYLTRPALAGTSEEEAAAFDHLSGDLTDFSKNWPGRALFVEIRFRGEPAPKGHSPKQDYFVRFDNIFVDKSVIPDVAKRANRDAAQLEGRLSGAFEKLAEIGVLTVNIRIPKKPEGEIPKTRKTLHLLNAFFRAARKPPEQRKLPLIANERKQPDPNLTAMMVLSRIKPDKMRALVRQARDGIRNITGEDAVYLSVYDALLTAQKLPVQLVRPPVEINTVKDFLGAAGGAKITKNTALVVNTVMDQFDKNPVKTLRVMDTIYGDEKTYGGKFVNKDHRVLGLRIREVDQLMTQSPDRPEKETFEKEVVGNIGSRLANVNDEVLDKLFIPEPVADIRKDRKGAITGTEILRGVENIRLKKMINYYRARAASRRKLREMIGRLVHLTDKDYAILAKDFKLTERQVRELVELLKGCFDADGKFRRRTFEKHIPQFAKYEKTVFEFLWHYLKTLSLPRGDRVSFLNSLQRLIDKIKLRNDALRMLLSDVFKYPTVIEYSDRNAIMLANLLVRKYNKEEMMDIELTPEEVLLVESGLDQDVIDAAENLIDGFQEIFLIKILTIHKNIKTALEHGETRLEGLSIRFILSLEREILAFFALVRGATARAVLRIAMTEYGDPKSAIYHQHYSPDYMSGLLQRLRLVVRGFGRIGEQRDVQILMQIQKNEKEFLKLGADAQNVVAQIMEYAGDSIKRIQNSGDGWVGF